MIGIYKITCVPTGRFYIGSGRNCPERWKQHRRDLSAGRHCNPRLQNAWNKYGREAFTFTVIEVLADVAQLLACERSHILTLKPEFNLNEEPQGGPLRAGAKNTPEHNAKIAAAHRGRRHTPEALAKMRAAKIGRAPWNKGKSGGSSWNKGRAWTAEERQRLRQSHAGETRTAEHRLKISEGLRRAWAARKQTLP